ncbi:f-box domain-containing [Pyrenophora seminiperda CCB06]|uniref:F-box domain-containing n=1 Tax=Pyrenophora seminiperda CCB06 TaxID=1302712 RepID=A0A3M7M1H3_9PLEO|nr:f-box domain-containing [Pyrenophora seminiperda CCB06]
MILAGSTHLPKHCYRAIMASAYLSSGKSRLPTELVLQVLDHLEGNNKALCSLAQTCRSMQQLAEERIYKTIELTSVADLHHVVKALVPRRDRARAVQTLKILYQYNVGHLKDSYEIRKTFNECVPHMINLREWHIESPYDNFHWNQAGGEAWVGSDMQQFRAALESACEKGPLETEAIAAEGRLGRHLERNTGLALLEKLTIHSHGANSDFWNLDGFHCLFRHPSLRHLHVSCIAFSDVEIPCLASHIKKTPLTSLVFDECELWPKSLRSILQTPAQLKHLTLGENVHNTSRSKMFNPVLTPNPVHSLEALSVVAHSLESLVHLDPLARALSGSFDLSSIRPPGDGLRHFHSLKYMEMGTPSFLHRAAVMNRDLAPPNLETLRVRQYFDDDYDLWVELPDLDNYAALPSLSTLELMQSSYLGDELSDKDYICDPDYLRDRHVKAYKLFKAGVSLKMLIEMHKTATLIPPYLHNEHVPIVRCVYDASAVGFHRHLKDQPADEAPQEPPETDQLTDADVSRLRGETARTLSALARCLIWRTRRSPFAIEAMSNQNDGVESSIQDVNTGGVGRDDGWFLSALDEGDNDGPYPPGLSNLAALLGISTRALASTRILHNGQWYEYAPDRPWEDTDEDEDSEWVDTDEEDDDDLADAVVSLGEPE